MSTLLGKEHGTSQTVSFTTSDTEKTVDLGHAYESVVIQITAAEAAQLAAASTIAFQVDGFDYHDDTGDPVTIPKPGATVGVHYVVKAAFIRELTIVLSAVPDATVDMTVWGQNRITKATDEILVQRTIPS